MNITIIFYVLDSLGMNSMRFDQSGCYCLHVRNFKTVTKFDGWRWQVAKADFAALVELLRGATSEHGAQLRIGERRLVCMKQQHGTYFA